MAELEKVINGLKCCTHAKAPIPCGDCSYYGNNDYNDAWSCRIALMRDALELLKEYKQQDGCPCTHCMEWECDEVCEEYKKWKDS